MQEAEVSLRVALYYIANALTDESVLVSIDGAHIKTGNTLHFDVTSFLAEQGCRKCAGEQNRWQGEYEVSGSLCRLIITSASGIGDVNIRLKSGVRLLVESKKGRVNKSSLEYPLMREAIGQLMTNNTIDRNTVPVVAVPYTKKSFDLASRWSGYELIKTIGIRFFLVTETGDITIV